MEYNCCREQSKEDIPIKRLRILEVMIGVPSLALLCSCWGERKCKDDSSLSPEGKYLEMFADQHAQGA